MNYDWRGGVRELENIIERAIIFSSGDKIEVNDLADNVNSSVSINNMPESIKEATLIFEKEHIKRVVKNMKIIKRKLQML